MPCKSPDCIAWHPRYSSKLRDVSKSMVGYSDVSVLERLYAHVAVFDDFAKELQQELRDPLPAKHPHLAVLLAVGPYPRHASL